MVDHDRINELRAGLEALGCTVIIWTADDFPGSTPEQQANNLHDFSEILCDRLIEKGNDLIDNEFGQAEDSD